MTVARSITRVEVLVVTSVRCVPGDVTRHVSRPFEGVTFWITCFIVSP